MEEQAYEGFITFEGNHLVGYRVKPMSVMLRVSGDSFNDARNNMVADKVLDIGTKFAYQYDLDEAPKMQKEHGMHLFTREELLRFKA